VRAESGLDWWQRARLMFRSEAFAEPGACQAPAHSDFDQFPAFGGMRSGSGGKNLSEYTVAGSGRTGSW
jgi:hypothetical protein